MKLSKTSGLSGRTSTFLWFIKGNKSLLWHTALCFCTALLFYWEYMFFLSYLQISIYKTDSVAMAHSGRNPSLTPMTVIPNMTSTTCPYTTHWWTRISFSPLTPSVIDISMTLVLLLCLEEKGEQLLGFKAILDEASSSLNVLSSFSQRNCRGRLSRKWTDKHFTYCLSHIYLWNDLQSSYSLVNIFFCSLFTFNNNNVSQCPHTLFHT